MAAFAVLGSSRPLAVGGDSASAAILAAALIGLAHPGSARYIQLAGFVALLTGTLLVLARLARLGFLANFLSRTVLLGFLAGVGIAVAAGQLPDMLGVPHVGTRTVGVLLHTATALPHVHPATAALSGAVIVIMVTARRITRRIPGGLIAVVGAIIVSRAAGLASHGVAVVGPVPRACRTCRHRALACTRAPCCSAPRRRSSSSSWPRARPPPVPTPPSTRNRSARTPT